MCCFNNAVTIDHEGLFLLVAAGFVRFFRDLSALQDTEWVRNWKGAVFADHNSPYPVEYLLVDRGYLGLDHFVFRRIDAREGADVDSNAVMRAFIKLHFEYRMKVE